MSDNLILAVDLKAKVAQLETQQAFAERLGVDRIHINRILNQQKSLSFPVALRSARTFGSVTILFEDQEYELKTKCPDDDGDKCKCGVFPKITDGATPVESALTATKEMRDVTQHMERIAEHARVIVKGSRVGKQFLSKAVKEVVESMVASERFLNAVQISHPEAHEEGVARAMAEIAEMYGVEKESA